MIFDKVLIVCIANICRSPLAEVILQDALTRAKKPCLVSSAGIHALINHSAAPHSVTVASAHNFDISNHKARQLTKEMMTKYPLILTMESIHIPMILNIAPFARGRVHRLGKWHDEEIEDPYQKSLAQFDATYNTIEKNVEAWLEKF